MREGAKQLKHLEPNACAFDESHVRDTKKCASVSRSVHSTKCSVSSLPSRARHSPMSVSEICEKKSTWHERVCSHHSSHQCWSCHSPWCGSCHFADSHHCVEDDACDQWDLQLWLCHSRSARSVSLNGLWRSFFLWNVDILSSLFTLKSYRSASGFQKIAPFSHRTWVRAVVHAQYKAVFTSASLFQVAQYEMSTVVRKSRYRQHSLVHPILVWDARYMSSLIHRSSMESWLCFLAPMFASFAFQWSCHWLSLCFAPLE